MRWIVREEDSVGEDLKIAFKRGEVTLEDIEVIRTWVKQVEEFGPESLQKTWNLSEGPLLNRPGSDLNFWNDHALSGKWKGHRSSSFSKLGRIIYRVESGEIRIVNVVKITAKHKY